MCARGAAFVPRGGPDGLRRRETGRALEAGLREDYRQLGTLQGVGEGVDGPRAGRRRRRLRGVGFSTKYLSLNSLVSANCQFPAVLTMSCVPLAETVARTSMTLL